MITFHTIKIFDSTISMRKHIAMPDNVPVLLQTTLVLTEFFCIIIVTII